MAGWGDTMLLAGAAGYLIASILGGLLRLAGDRWSGKSGGAGQ